MESRIITTGKEWPDSGLGEVHEMGGEWPIHHVGTSQVSCRHAMNGHQIPCHPMCRVQEWPRSMFRWSILRRRYVLKRKYR